MESVAKTEKNATTADLEAGKWVELSAHRSDETVPAEPFEAVEVDLWSWFGGVGGDESAYEG